MPQDVAKGRKSQATASKSQKQAKTKFVFQSIPLFRRLVCLMLAPKGLAHTCTAQAGPRMPQDVAQHTKKRTNAKTNFVFQSIPVFRRLLGSMWPPRGSYTHIHSTGWPQDVPRCSTGKESTSHSKQKPETSKNKNNFSVYPCF